MNYKEKRTIVQICSGILVLAAYGIFAFSKVFSGTATVEIKYWAIAMLIFIGIGIVASIIIQIVFHIIMSVALAVKEHVQNGNVDERKIERTLEQDMVEDEMDKQIELRSMRISFTIAGLGFAASLVTLIMGMSPAVMINILFGSFSIGSIIEGFAQLYYYRRGIKNGR